MGHVQISVSICAAGFDNDLAANAIFAQFVAVFTGVVDGRIGMRIHIVCSHGDVA